MKKFINMVVIFVLISLLLYGTLPVINQTIAKDCKIILRFQQDNVMYLVDDTEKGPMDTPPVNIGGRLFLVVRYVTDEIPGTTIDWVSETKTVIIGTSTGKIIELQIGNKDAKIDGQLVQIDSDNPEIIPFISEGRTLLPMRFVAENLGANGSEDIVWHEESKTVDLIFKDIECTEENVDQVFDVSIEDVIWIDSSREREVPLLIYAPDLKNGKGPFPTVIFSHGGGESRYSYSYLGNHLASHGYIVVFLTHRGSDRAAIDESGKTGIAAMTALDGIDKFHKRPEDISFVLDRLFSDDLDSKLLTDRVDEQKLAVGGQCAGATTAFAMVGLNVNLPEGDDVTFLDQRFKCAFTLSPQPGAKKGKYGLHDQSWANIQTPTLVITGSRDFNWIPQVKANPKLVQLPYDNLPAGDKYLVEIADAEHNAFTDSVPYYPARERDPRHHGWICKAVTAFLDAQLKGDENARSWLEDKELEKETNKACRQESKHFDFSIVDDYIEKSLGRMDGGCCLILIKDDRIVHRKAYGNFTLDKVVPIASASKWISGGVVMALVDEGVITLDTKASTYLKSFTGEKAEITIRQMFSHTNGFKGGQEKPNRNVDLTMEQAVEQIAKMPLAYEPGTKLLYGGLGMQVAGHMCELASGKKWLELFHEKIGDPLRMKNTDYLALGETENPNVAGSVRSCVDDYGNFMRMLLNGGIFEGKRVLSENAVETMLTNQTGSVPIERSACTNYMDFDPGFAESRYGIGCWLENIDPVTDIAGEATSGGAFGCIPFIGQKRKIAGVFLPMSRKMKVNSEGNPYNDATAVFLELRPLIRDVFDNNVVKPEDESSVNCADMVQLHDTNRNKDLQVCVTWPKHKGYFPVIVFSHRVSGSRLDYKPIVEHWVKNGYVVIQADHSDSRELSNSDSNLDWINRTHDLSFLIDSLSEIESLVPDIKGKMDNSRIGAGGHLIGAYAACTLAGQKNFNPTAPKDLKDDRIKSTLLLSPQGRGQGLTEDSWNDVTGPMMVLNGSKIPSRRTENPAQWRCEPFTYSPPGNKYLVWIEDMNGNYAGLIQPGVGDDSKFASWILDTTLTFWNAHLKDDTSSHSKLCDWPIPEEDKTNLRIECKEVESKKLFTELAADYSAENDGRAVIVMVDGKIVFERYDNGFGPETSTHLHSATKGFWGPVIAAMIEDGLIESFDEFAVKTIDEWETDSIKSRITIRHLLTLSAGLFQDVEKLQGHNRDTLAQACHRSAVDTCTW